MEKKIKEMEIDLYCRKFQRVKTNTPLVLEEKLKSLNITEEDEVIAIKAYLQKVKDTENLDKKEKDKEEKKPILKVENAPRI